MSCSIEDHGAHKKVELTFKRDQLLYDIQNYSYVESHVMPSDAEHSRHMVADIGESGNVDRVTRVLDLAISTCREMLYPFAQQELIHTTFDDNLQETDCYTLELSLPSTFSETTITLLEQLIHEYLVCRAVGDWMSITNPQKAEIWFAKAAEVESEIRVTLHSRKKRVRIVQHW